jgi:hypothetical protein
MFARVTTTEFSPYRNPVLSINCYAKDWEILDKRNGKRDNNVSPYTVHDR